MRCWGAALAAILFSVYGAEAQISSFKHIIVVIQENRTPDNLFQGLCIPASMCGVTSNTTQYDIQMNNWSDKTAASGVTQPVAVPLANAYDLDHAHSGFVAQCDLQGSVCKMDGAASLGCSGTCPPKPAYAYVDDSTGAVDPYIAMARQYGWANLMFQTNQGASFAAHQFLFGGTSAPTAAQDAQGIFAADNPTPFGTAVAGCVAPAGTTIALITPAGETGSTYPCFEHQTMGDLGFSWRYYSPGVTSVSNTLWNAPLAIRHICVPDHPGGVCTGEAWARHVDLNPSDVLTDIANCKLQSVSWVNPTGQNSDHANMSDGGGPSWVAAIINAVGTSTGCDQGRGYWNDTAILVTWDDWGGWYDHESPPILPGVQGSYQYGFRVPFIFISAYTSPGYINPYPHDFGTIARFIEQNFGAQEGVLNFADARSTTDLLTFFNLSATPRAFSLIPAAKPAAFFLNDQRPALAPDND